MSIKKKKACMGKGRTKRLENAENMSTVVTS